MDQFEGLNTQVLGISVDSVPCLKAWAESLGGITYPLLSDFYPHGEVAQRYGVLRKEGYSERAIFIVDKKGIVRYRDIHDINEQPNNEELFKVLRQMEPEAARKSAETAAATEGAKRLAETAAAAEPVAPIQEEQANGAEQPNITIYCTPWCADCRAAKRYLDQRRLRYTEIDISKDKAGEKRVRELANGRVVTPTFDIDGTIVLDFDKRRLDQALGES